MNCRLVGAKPLSEPMPKYCWLDPWEQTSVKFKLKFIDFPARKSCNWYCSYHINLSGTGLVTMTSSGNFLRVTGPLCGEFTCHLWIPHTKASDADLWSFLWSVPWINGWVNNRKAGGLRRHCGHYDVIVMHQRGNMWGYMAQCIADFTKYVTKLQPNEDKSQGVQQLIQNQMFLVPSWTYLENFIKICS